ncbi:MAG TPA: hypothetical protein VKJ45_28720, partial [Blastocatellia bacterium]|nr:hypothetical protein [Blastocatellia bacterium]
MKFRLGLVLCWCLIMTGAATYAPFRSQACLQLLLPPSRSRVLGAAGPVFTLLPVRCSAGFQRASAVLPSSKPLLPAWSNNSALPDLNASHSLMRSQGNRKRVAVARSKAAGLPPEPGLWVNAQVNALL